MKRVGYYAVIVLFVGVLWLPLLCTPFFCERERTELREREQRTPAGELHLDACGGDIAEWTRSCQDWYRDSFAFRTELMRVYNGTHYLVRSYPGELFGAGGQLLDRGTVCDDLAPLGERRVKTIRKNLNALRSLCAEKEIPCVFIIIPENLSVHPDWAPGWLRERDTRRNALQLMEMAREMGFEVFDLADGLRAYAEETGMTLYRRYDVHWDMMGALWGYEEMIRIIGLYCSEARRVPESSYSVGWTDEDIMFTRRRYLEVLLSERLSHIRRIDLPPVQVVEKDGRVTERVKYYAWREGVRETRCPALGTQTVLFMRDSFLSSSSLLLNHSLPHAVYLNFSNEGKEVRKAVERYQPDLLVIGVQETRLRNALLWMRFADED